MIWTTMNTIYLACPMCTSGAVGKSVMAANTAILVLLAILLVVLGLIVSMMVHLAKRARRLANDMADSNTKPQ